jgi:hypothetical protein
MVEGLSHPPLAFTADGGEKTVILVEGDFGGALEGVGLSNKLGVALLSEVLIPLVMSLAGGRSANLLNLLV